MINFTIHYCCNLLLNEKINYIYIIYIIVYDYKIKCEDIKEIKKK